MQNNTGLYTSIVYSLPETQKMDDAITKSKATLKEIEKGHQFAEERDARPRISKTDPGNHPFLVLHKDGVFCIVFADQEIYINTPMAMHLAQAIVHIVTEHKH